MFKTSFVAVPAFIRVEPVTTSAPTIGAITTSAAILPSFTLLQERNTVFAPNSLDFSRTPRT